MNEMQRSPDPQQVTIGTTVGASTTIEKPFRTTGSFQLPTGSGTTEVSIYASLDGVNWEIPSFDGSSLAVIACAVGVPYGLPDELYKLPRFKLVASAGDATEDVPVWLTS